MLPLPYFHNPIINHLRLRPRISTKICRIHKLEEINTSKGNPEHEEHVKKTLQYGEGYIINLLDKNQRAAYSKKENLLRKEELIRERQEMAKEAAKRN